jgi:hypothetical protein
MVILVAKSLRGQPMTSVGSAVGPPERRAHLAEI